MSACRAACARPKKSRKSSRWRPNCFASPPPPAPPPLPLPDLQPGATFLTDTEANAVEIARSLLPAKEKGNNLFALEVKGDSMIDAMINDGDIVVRSEE